MRIARIRYDGPDGAQPRIVVAAAGETSHWVDVRTHVRLRHERAGATPSGARRLAEALAPGSLTAALEGGDAFLDGARDAAADASGDARAPAGARLLAPVDAPAYRDFMAFEEHFVNAGRRRNKEPPQVLYEFPVSYMGSVQALLGPDDEVPWPPYTESMDYELELGIVVGRGGREITPESAREHILGLTVFDDFSARDIQLREMAGNLGPSKGKHFASSVGPWIVTLDELGDRPLAMSARINGETWSEGSTGTMMWSIDELVAWAATGEPLAAGTLLGSGTVGRGCGLELDRRLQPGDVVELEIEGIGVLRNTLGSPPGSQWMPQPRRMPHGLEDEILDSRARG
jgi:2-keto-4-pentenoate hydratase/2-oxohepta-3-ene-1,7-dioic acid hydratase in catechol pathway